MDVSFAHLNIGAINPESPKTSSKPKVTRRRRSRPSIVPNFKPKNVTTSKSGIIAAASIPDLRIRFPKPAYKNTSAGKMLTRYIANKNARVRFVPQS